MCYEFEFEYYRRVEEARKALQRDEEKRRQQKPAAPSKPADDRQPEQADPVPL